MPFGIAHRPPLMAAREWLPATFELVNIWIGGVCFKSALAANALFPALLTLAYIRARFMSAPRNGCFGALAHHLQ